MYRSIRLSQILGIPISVDPSWIVIFLLVSWTLSVGWFPQTNPNLSSGLYWVLGIISALFLFASLLAHEMAHSLVAKRFGIPIKGITLFIFGGVAQMGREPENPKAEFLMAIAGPLTSFTLGFIFLVLAALAALNPALGVVESICSYLFLLNFIVGTFNLLPGFPLDGGRILRSSIWHFTNNFRRATEIAANFGKTIAYLMILWGFVNFVLGSLIGGIWMILIGFFLREAAASSYQQVLTKGVLHGVHIGDIMTPHVISIPPLATVQEAIDTYFLRHHHMTFPVAEQDKIVGLVSLQDIKRLPHDTWRERRVFEVMLPVTEKYTLSPQDEAVEALTHMVRDDLSALPVIQGGHLLGIITQRDIFRFLKIKMDLE